MTKFLYLRTKQNFFVNCTLIGQNDYSHNYIDKHSMKTEISIRAFRATDDPETCEKFIEGHRKVLEHHGIAKVTSSNEEWAESSSVFVVVVEDLERKKLYGGARVHAADGRILLPIEEATKEFDERIMDYVRHYARNGTGELCG